MVDPVSNEGISKVAERTGVDEAASRSGADAESDAGDVSFDEVLDGKRAEAERTVAIDAPESTDAVDRAEMREVDDVRGSTGDGERVKFGAFVDRLSDDRAEIDRMLDRTMSGADLDQRELLEMQTLIYSYSRRVELTSKVVDKATGGLKQMMNVRV